MSLFDIQFQRQLCFGNRLYAKPDPGGLIKQPPPNRSDSILNVLNKHSHTIKIKDYVLFRFHTITGFIKRHPHSNPLNASDLNIRLQKYAREDCLNNDFSGPALPH